MWRQKAEGERMHLAPLGFRNARDAEGMSVIEPDSETCPLVMEALAMRERGDSIRTICRTMAQKELRSKRGQSDPSGCDAANPEPDQAGTGTLED